MELGQTKDRTEPFVARRTIINNANAKDVERVMNKFRMASIKMNTMAPEQSSGIAFWRKNEPDVANLLDDDALSFDDVINCPLCREEFKRFKKKTRCLICLRVVCSNCNSKTLPIKGMQDGVEREIKMCDACYGTITKEQKRLQLKQFFAASAKSSFVSFYEGAYLLVTVIQRDLPKFRLLVNSPMTATKLKKAKELDASLTENLKDFEREIKSIEHFQVNTKKQQQLRDAIKIGFVTALSGTAPEFKVLHKQLEVAATQPLAPEESDTDSPLIAKVVQTSASTPSTTPSSTPNTSPAQKKDKRRLTTRLSTFFSSSSLSSSSSSVKPPSVGKPSISGISPVLSPLSGGTHITINGENFDYDCRVEIGNEECIVIERNPDTLIVLSPPKKESAPVDVCVINKGGERSVFSNVLFYAEDSLFRNETPSISDSYGSTYGTSQPVNNNEQYSNNDTYNNTPTPTGTSPQKIAQNGHRTFGNQHSSPPKQDELRHSSHRTFGQPGQTGNFNRSPSAADLNGSSGSTRTFGNPPANASPTKPMQTGGSSRNFSNLSPFESGSASSSGSSGSYRGFGNTGSTPSTLDLNGGSYNKGNDSYSPPNKATPNGANSSFKSLNLNNSVRNNYGDEDEGGELSVTMINPVVSPLQGTKIMMELSKALPPDTKVKVGGKPAASRVSETNPRMISFVSPALPAGITNIEIITGPGKSTMMEGILMYEVLSPQYSSNYARSDTVKSSGRVWGKK